MNKRVKVAKRATDTQEDFGKAGKPKYEILGTFWMSETFNKGAKSLREGAFDAYDTVMFRCRFNKNIDRWCLLKFNLRLIRLITPLRCPASSSPSFASRDLSYAKC